MPTTTESNVLPGTLETHFEPFRHHIVGQFQTFQSPYGKKRILYADWTASGRLYQPIEEKLLHQCGPFVGNTHTETNVTGTSMTLAYHHARKIIKEHVNASPSDCIISYGSGMTGVINKFQRILGLKLPERWRYRLPILKEEKPIVFVTHMEHHSNQTSWLETICDLEVIPSCSAGLVDLEAFEKMLDEYKDRKTKIAAVTACSNVTGIQTPYHQIAGMIHRAGGVCFVDFACSAPYVPIDMHPENPDERLDAIYFSPHKFLGGPGTSGILIFDDSLYHNRVPDNPGGGTVVWTDPWKGHGFIENIEDREDGGTPPFLQTIQIAMCIRLKEEMGLEQIKDREEHLVHLIFDRLEKIPAVHILAEAHRDRLGVFSFLIQDVHYNLVVRMLNDRFGIQVRGGCSCAGTYGHYLLEISQEVSKTLRTQIQAGDQTGKPGWVRMSIHPTMTDAEAHFICDAIQAIAENGVEWSKDYEYDAHKNDFKHTDDSSETLNRVESWFD
ncbi:MAG: aminotransferase class V-fold PLP-dependent enzyme [Saprospiraceae bacterium]